MYYLYVKSISEISDFTVKFFNHGKFHEDPLISRSIADKRNQNMVKDLTKKYKTYVGKVNDKIFGFMILKKVNNFVELYLGGIHKDYRLLSFSFWNRVFFECKKMGAKKIITTISATNISAVNLYIRFGFKFSQGLYGYRKFRD